MAIVRKILAIPASSASPERIHSTAKDVLGRKRKRLRAELGGALVLARMRARHYRNRKQVRPIQWMMLGEIVPIDAIKSLGDWTIDKEYDSDLEDGFDNVNNNNEVDNDVNDVNDDDDDNINNVNHDDNDNDDDNAGARDNDDNDDNNSDYAGASDNDDVVPRKRVSRMAMRYNDYYL